MSKVIIGVDPDSKAHGVAFYENGVLIKLQSMSLMEFYSMMLSLSHLGPVIHIEDVNAVSAAFGARDKRREGGISVKLKMAQDIGMCKQAQIEVERACESLGVKVVRHKISKQWKCAKNGKAMFQRITGWLGRSNEDTRSAAYFGWLGVTGK